MTTVTSPRPEIARPGDSVPQTANRWPRHLRAFVICVPLHDNAGRPFPEPTIRTALDRIARIGGGCSALPAGHGLWVNQHDDLVYDRIMPVTVVTPASEQVFAELTETTSWLARLLDQVEIFVLTLPLTSPETMSAAASRVRFLEQTAA